LSVGPWCGTVGNQTQHLRIAVVKTYHQTHSEVQRDWLLVDADDQVVGRLATQIATLRWITAIS